MNNRTILVEAEHYTTGDKIYKIGVKTVNHLPYKGKPLINMGPGADRPSGGIFLRVLTPSADLNMLSDQTCKNVCYTNVHGGC